MPRKLLFSHILTKGLFSSDTEFVDGLKYRFHRVKRAEDNREDIYDGVWCQTLWTCLPNHLHYICDFYRKANKYGIFGDLWFAEEKPFFSTFFNPIVDTLWKTEIHG